MSTRVEGATVLITVTAHATLDAGPVHLSLAALEGPAPGTWRYSLHDGTDRRAAYGRVAGMTDHMQVLRYAAGICVAGYQPGTIERGLLEQFAADDTPDTPQPGKAGKSPAPRTQRRARPSPKRALKVSYRPRRERRPDQSPSSQPRRAYDEEDHQP
jgi:NAD(P)-dependent dehydrogenase (short-subunit alcohol dehydrogenase family)